MDDREVALLVLVIAARADGGCVPCVQGCVDEAIYQRPNLPWEEVTQEIRPESVRREIIEAVRSAREWVDHGGRPRHVDPGRVDGDNPFAEGSGG